MPKIPTTAASVAYIDVKPDTKPYPPTSPKKTLASPKKTGKQAAKKWSKQDKIDILLKVVATASPDWQVSIALPVIVVQGWCSTGLKYGGRIRCVGYRGRVRGREDEESGS